MKDNSGEELTRQKKIVETLNQMREELVSLQNSRATLHPFADVIVPRLISQLDFLSEETNYLFEVSNCKQLMLSSTTERIKQLEAELAELKSRKQ